MSLLALVALGALSACEPEEVVPVEPQGAVLQPGRYDMVVREVVASACDTDAGVMRGQVVSAELTESDEGVSFSFAGWMLHGEMEPGNLHVRGAVDEPEDVPVEEEVEPEEVDYGDDDDVVEQDDEREPVEHEHEGEEGRPGEAPSGRRASALLDARILEPELAEGTLFVSLPDCEIELSVVIGRGGPRGGRPGGGEPPPTEPHEGEDDHGESREG